jgi:hypothetical protein
VSMNLIAKILLILPLLAACAHVRTAKRLGAGGSTGRLVAALGFTQDAA